MAVKKYNGLKVRLNKMVVGRLADDPNRRAIPTNLQKAKTVGVLFVVNQEK